MNIILTLDRAVEVIKDINRKRMSVSLSYLPVATNDPRKVQQNVRTYIAILDRIRDEHLDSDITLKPHQFGALGHERLAAESIQAVIEHASRVGNFVWIDMERESTVPFTIELFERMWERYRNVGICMQAYLERTEADMRYLLNKHVPMRLVKGFYRSHDIKEWSRVTENFEHLMTMLLQQSERPCIATHDRALVEKAVRIVEEQDIRNAEFQFFRGEGDELAEQLTGAGLNVRIYVPYGHVVQFLLKGLPTFDIFYHLRRFLGGKGSGEA